MRLIASAFMTLALAGTGSAQAQTAQGQTLKVNYAISLAGLPLGKADLSSTFSGRKYELEGYVKLSGLARLLTGGKGFGSASGTLAGVQPRSKGFSVTSKTSSKQQFVRMGMAGGNVADVEMVPPPEPKSDRVPVKDEDKKGVVDPLSALIMPAVASKSMTDESNCNRTIPVFDGASRMDVVLSYAETKSVAVPGYSGPVLVCNIRWVPISGHRTERPATKFMKDNKDMSVWLAPVDGQRVLFPIRVAVRTMVGMGELEAQSWSVEKDAKVVPASGKAGGRANRSIKAGAAQ